ncbi:hypothetical protein E9531_02635 [Lampropedia puyangensis]|uniref:Uncharacterized protein n=1 Tax=Lampropedia puyangensis TaxID=1330072 RepID=A0A4S8FIJ5_9BURK|nr:hypothetical protein [Lampropedia puyangensis]THU05452.1 hypothetical protein E9531_02635 [Lampropedia puyangensis]
MFNEEDQVQITNEYAALGRAIVNFEKIIDTMRRLLAHMFSNNYDEQRLIAPLLATMTADPMLRAFIAVKSQHVLYYKQSESAPITLYS